MSPSDSEPPGRLSALAAAADWRVVLRDLVIVLGWVLALSFAFRALGWPTWLYYVVAFAGVVALSFVGRPWIRSEGR